MLQSLIDLALDTGFFYVDWRMMVMWGVVLVLFYLAVFKEYEPLLLIPIAFGALLANLPTEGVLNKPAEAIVSPANGTLQYVFKGEGEKTFVPRYVKAAAISSSFVTDGKEIALSAQTAQKDIQAYLDEVAKVTSPEGRNSTEERAKGIPDLLAIVRPDSEIAKDSPEAWKHIPVEVEFNGRKLAVAPADVMVWAEADSEVSNLPLKEGDKVVEGKVIMETYSHHSGGLYHYIKFGVLLEIFPPIIFLGVGALTDFGSLIANPRTLLLGAAAQFGVFATFIGAISINWIFPGMGFTSQEAAAIGIIGGADGPTSIFIANKLAPHIMAPIAVAAYSYMALVPIIQPPIMRALTTEKERKIRMKSLRKVSRTEKLIFAVIVTIFCILLVPAVSPLIAMLMLGNFLRESGVCDRLSKAAQNEIINIVTIFLGTSVGITMTGDRFLRVDTLFILALGVVAFGVATSSGVLMAKFMNLFSKEKINPLIGSAGVSAVPMAARVSQVEGQRADPSNFLLMHAMGPNVAGVIGTAMVAGFFITAIAGS